MTQLLTSHKLTSKLIDCFKDEESQEEMCEYVDDLSFAMIDMLFKKIPELTITNRVNIARIVDGIRCDKTIDKPDDDQSVLRDMIETFAVHIENEEGWGVDDDDDDAEDNEDDEDDEADDDNEAADI
jgi:hypothetical protein